MVSTRHTWAESWDVCVKTRILTEELFEPLGESIEASIVVEVQFTPYSHGDHLTPPCGGYACPVGWELEHFLDEDGMPITSENPLFGLASEIAEEYLDKYIQKWQNTIVGNAINDGLQ